MHYIMTFGVVLAALVFWIISVQRSLVVMNENANNAMLQIGVQLSSEWDILTSLLDLAEWYANYECITIIETMKGRRSVTKDSLPDDVTRQERMIAETKKKLTEVAENFSELKVDRGYVKTLEAVSQYENMLQTSKLIYNDSAATLNRTIAKFPTSMISGVLGFSNRGYFEEGG